MSNLYHRDGLLAGDILVALRISKDLLFVALFMLTIPALATAATEGPQPPCGSATAPPYSPPGVPPEVKLWHDDDLRRAGWRPPLLGLGFVIALSGHSRDGTQLPLRRHH